LPDPLLEQDRSSAKSILEGLWGLMRRRKAPAPQAVALVEGADGAIEMAMHIDAAAGVAASAWAGVDLEEAAVNGRGNLPGHGPRVTQSLSS
jgi:hypothetical protein